MLITLLPWSFLCAEFLLLSLTSDLLWPSDSSFSHLFDYTVSTRRSTQLASSLDFSSCCTFFRWKCIHSENLATSSLWVTPSPVSRPDLLELLSHSVCCLLGISTLLSFCHLPTLQIIGHFHLHVLLLLSLQTHCVKPTVHQCDPSLFSSLYFSASTATTDSVLSSLEMSSYVPLLSSFCPTPLYRPLFLNTSRDTT